jgi:hypothetical protein
MTIPTDPTAQAIAGQAELGQAAPMAAADPAELGQQVADGGAGATAVDTDQLLAMLADLQKRVAGVEAERAAERTAGKPGIVATAELVLAHLAHRHGALSAGSPLGPAVEKAGALVEAAKSAAESGSGDEVGQLAGALAAHLARVSGAAASADTSYPHQLLTEDLPEAIGALAAGAAKAAL